ncbi:MAG: hypothetical protein ACE5GO_11985, partial [Anaerolineales bacterium]
ILSSLLALPYPIITRYLIDDVILNRQVHLLVGAALLLAGIKLGEKLAAAFQQFYFANFEQAVMLDVQHDLFDRACRDCVGFFPAPWFTSSASPCGL